MTTVWEGRFFPPEAVLDLRSLWHQGPDAWGGWLALAAQLSESNDERGEILQLAHAARTPDEHAQVHSRIEAWLHSPPISTEAEDCLDTLLDLYEGYGSLEAHAPPALAAAMHRPLAQLIAAPQLAVAHFGRVQSAIIQWIELAFDKVPPPGPAHRTLRQAEAFDSYDVIDRSGDPIGPWQSYDDAYLLSCQWSLSHLDAHGLVHYLPAVMCFGLRHMLASHPEDCWLTESLSYTLDPSNESLREHTKGRFSMLTGAQRAAIAAYCWATINAAMPRWVQSLDAGEAWFEAFWHAPGA